MRVLLFLVVLEEEEPAGRGQPTVRVLLFLVVLEEEELARGRVTDSASIVVFGGVRRKKPAIGDFTKRGFICRTMHVYFATPGCVICRTRVCNLPHQGALFAALGCVICLIQVCTL